MGLKVKHESLQFLAEPDVPDSQCSPIPVPQPSWGRVALEDFKVLVPCGRKQASDTEMKKQMAAGWASRNILPQGGDGRWTDTLAP